jgi:type II secretory pathway component PulJ
LDIVMLIAMLFGAVAAVIAFQVTPLMSRTRSVLRARALDRRGKHQ